MKYVYIENLGCAKNQVDAEIIAHLLKDKGFEVSETIDDASVVIVNSCGFLDSARQESIEVFFSLYNMHPDKKFIFSGCMAQRYPDEIFEQLGEADAVFGNHDLGKITGIIDKIEQGERVMEVPVYPSADRESWRRGKLFGFPRSAYLKISEGCDHRCAYCAIPLIRGDLRSRPFETIVEEAEQLVARGMKEINIIAQDLAAYGTDTGESRFKELLEALVSIEGEYRYRMLYIHPDFFPDWLPGFVSEHRDRILPYFDLPIQHVDPAVLSKMGRTGDAETYLKLFNSIRETLPDAVIRTTLLLGYPGETEKSFEMLESFIRSARLDWLGCFCYSREEGTVGWTLRDQDAHDEAHVRAEHMNRKVDEIQRQISCENLERFVGNTYYALIEEPIEGENLAIGRIYAQAPDVDGSTVVIGHDLKAGEVVKVGITRVNDLDLEAVVIDE